jgi:hypothetical protein
VDGAGRFLAVKGKVEDGLWVVEGVGRGELVVL